MFDRETRRAKVLEARGRAKRDNRARSAGEVRFIRSMIMDIIIRSFF